MDFKRLTTYIMLGLTISTLFYGIYFKGAFDSDFKRSWELKIYSNHIIKNDLPLLDKQLDLKNDEWMSDKPLIYYYNFVKDNYKYDDKLYNCKYWSINWALYFEKNNVKWQFVHLKTHVFVVAEYPYKYCIADGEMLRCIHYEEKHEN